NDTAGPMDVNVSGSFTSSSVRFGAGASGQGFRLIGPSGTLYLGGTGSTAPLIIDNNAYIGVTDMASLGSGSLTLANTIGYVYPGSIRYTGTTSSSTKAITLGANGGQIWVDSTGANLTLSGVISETGPGQRL